jgi:hypothetical protein
VVMMMMGVMFLKSAIVLYFMDSFFWSCVGLLGVFQSGNINLCAQKSFIKNRLLFDKSHAQKSAHWFYVRQKLFLSFQLSVILSVCVWKQIR